MSGLEMRYFVLKPKGKNKHAEASRKALRAYARHIREENEQFADELEEWANQEQVEAMKKEDAPLINEPEIGRGGSEGFY